MSLFIFPLAVFAFCQIYAAISDAASMRISNKLCLAVMVAFLFALPVSGADLGATAEHFLVGLTIFVVGFILFAVGGMGGGDSKLMAATALWWSWSDLALYIVAVTALGGVLAIVILAGRHYVPVRIATGALTSRIFSDQKRMPYGIALSLGALIVLPSSDIVQRALLGG